MGRKIVLVDDVDGTELPDGTQPIVLSLDGKTYNIYLSEKNQAKLQKVLKPFLANAETVSPTARRGTGRSASGKDKERMRRIREWAIATKYEFTNAQGEKKTLGDRGRIPDEVVNAYEAANG